MPSKKRTKSFIFEMFRIYRVHRFLVIELGLILVAAGITPILELGYPNAKIKTFGESMWWAVTTATSTGYGDYVPLSWGGRVIATILMFSGIALFSTTVALVSSYFSHRRIVRDNIRVDRKLEDLEEKITNLITKVDFLVKNETNKQLDDKDSIS